MLSRFARKNSLRRLLNGVQHLSCERQASTALDEHEKLIVESVRRFSVKEIGPRARGMDEAGELHKDVLQGLFRSGLMGATIPEKYGGSGFSFFEACLAVEEISKIDAAVAVIVDIQNTLVNSCLVKWGTEAQKDEWLPQLATSVASSFSLSETGSGSDAFALKTQAQESGDSYILNGEKSWVSNAKEAGLFLVMANADRDKGYKGVTCFLVPRSTPGLLIGPPEKKLGIRASSTCALSFDNVKVPKTSILGGKGRGYKIAIDALNEGRVGIAAQMIGLAQGALDVALP